MTTRKPYFLPTSVVIMFAALVIVLRLAAQITQPATTGMVSQLPNGVGAPSTVITCNAASQGLPYYETSTNQEFFCNGSAWTLVVGQVGPQGPAGTNGTNGVNWYLNGVAQTNVKCGVWTGTTSAGGTATVNVSALGITTLFGPPLVGYSSASASTAGVTSYSTSSASVLTNAGTTISIVGINILSLGASAMPYSLWLCGT